MINIELKISSMMQSRVEDVFNKEDISILDSGELLVRTTLPNKEWLLTLLFSVGEHLEVIAPADLREAVAMKLQKMTEKISIKWILKVDRLLSNDRDSIIL